jgi:hypothetical protein
MAKRMAKRKPLLHPYDPIEWAGAFALAVGSIAAYVIWNTTFLWWVAPLGTFPFLFMLAGRARARGWERDDAKQFKSEGDGPFTPPDGI